MAHPTSARIWCRGCRKGGTKWTSIDGEGPTAEERDRLFERYEQHQSGTRWMPNPEELQRLWERYDGRNSDGEEACAEERESLFGSYEQHQGHCTLVPMPSPPPPPRSRLRCLGASIGSAGIAGGTGGNVESSKRPPAKRFGAGAHAVAAAAAAAGMCRRDAGAAT
jgi:hypothetical protein